MGTWGAAPWDNDAAADWFAEFMDTTGIAKQVEQTLQLDIDDNYEEIGAASAVLVLLGHTYVWPVDDIDRHLELATSRLEEILEKDIFEGEEEFTQSIQEEIKLLRSRIGGGAEAEETDKVKWWRF